MFKKKLSLALDKLEITYYRDAKWIAQFNYASDDDTRFFGDLNQIQIKRQECKNYTFEYSVSYYYEGRTHLIGYLYWGHVKAKRQDIYFSYTNESLYNVFLLSLRFYIETSLGLTFFRVSKIDIALDTNFNIVKRFYKVLRNPQYVLYLNGKKTPADMNTYIRDIEGHYVGSRNEPYKYKTFYIHNSKKTMIIRGYNKSLEIAEESGKYYVEHHAEHHVGCGDLYRFEISCKNCELIQTTLNSLGVKYQDEIYSKLQSNSFLFDFFQNVSNRLIKYSFRKKSYSLIEVIFNEGT